MNNNYKRPSSYKTCDHESQAPSAGYATYDKMQYTMQPSSSVISSNSLYPANAIRNHHQQQNQSSSSSNDEFTIPNPEIGVRLF